jgi:hypothetical protein
MANRRKFRSLKWVDFRNNLDIFTVPKKYLDLLKLRWGPGGKYHPTFRVISEECSQLHVCEYERNS